MSQKFSQSVQLLQELKESQSEVERLRMEQAAELLKVREELVKTKREEEERRQMFAQEKRNMESALEQAAQEN